MTLVNWNAMNGSIKAGIKHRPYDGRQPPTGIKPYTTWISNVIYQNQDSQRIFEKSIKKHPLGGVMR
ncbi:hypothetical protein H8E77_02640 [bacterium]|nr:hypothetical protein [bacterium]